MREEPLNEQGETGGLARDTFDEPTSQSDGDDDNLCAEDAAEIARLAPSRVRLEQLAASYPPPAEWFDADEE